MKKQYNNISLSGSSLCIKRFVCAIMLMAPVLLFAQTWEVPPDKNTQVSPVNFDEQFQKEGAVLYKKHCLSCHGEPGKNAPALLTPSPGNPASEKFRTQTDGAIFFKITTGKGLMPKFESVLKETERWQIIAYIRTFHKGYIQPELSVVIDDGGKTFNITLTVIDKNTLQTKTFSVEQNDTIPAENISLILLMKRYFGNIQIGESKTTNEQGVVFFSLADDLRADTAGNITFIVRPENTELYGDAEAVSVVETGIKNIHPPLNEERALWNTLKKTPAFMVEEDLVHGKETMLWFIAKKLGTYEVLCAEYYGLRHSYMISDAIVLTEEDFNVWLAVADYDSTKVEHPRLVILKKMHAPDVIL